MANLKLSLGMIPSTSKVEQAEADLVKEYEKLQAFVDSKELAKYNELDALVNTSDFRNKKKEIEGLHYKNSEEYNRENEFKKLNKASDLKKYFKTRDGEQLKSYRELEGSDKVTRYEKLKETVSSSEFKQKKKLKDFRESEDYKMLQEFKTLDSQQELRSYYKFKASKEFANFNNVEGSQKLSRYEELKEYVAKDEFKERKEYLLDRKRFEKTDMFKQLQEYETLSKSDDIVWYFKVKDSDKFDLLKNRELTFSDDFEGEKLDTMKWLTNHYWGDRLLNDHFSYEKDLHCFTESDNFEVRNSVLRIITKPQKAEGKVWNPQYGGFRKKEFGYTSGTINTGKSFRQQYGIFKAKVKLTTSLGPRHAFYMLADKITPHLDICRSDRGKVWMDLFRNVSGQKSQSLSGFHGRSG